MIAGLLMPLIIANGCVVTIHRIFAVLLGEAAHEVRHVNLACALARPPLEPIGVEEVHEQLEVGVVNRPLYRSLDDCVSPL